MEKITSAQNAIIRDTVKLLDSKYRKEKQLFLLYGDKLIAEAIRGNYQVQIIFYVEEPDILTLVSLDENLGTQKVTPAPRTIQVTLPLMEKLSELSSPPKLIAVVHRKPDEEIDLEESKNYILLENLQDPSNVGTIFRTAEAFGLQGVLFVGSKVDVYSPKVLRGSMGSSLRLPSRSYETVAQAKKAIQGAKLRLFGTALDRTAVTLEAVVFPKGSVLAIGNEGQGLTADLLAVSDERVFIEMQGETNSLSAPIAAAVAMYKMQICAGREEKK